MKEPTSPVPTPSQPLDLPDVAALRGETRWGGAIAATVILDAVGLAALWLAYLQFHVVELAYGIAPAYSLLFVRLLLFAPLAQAGALVIARRNHHPWVVPVWAAPFTMAAVFAAVWGMTSVSGIQAFVG